MLISPHFLLFAWGPSCTFSSLSYHCSSCFAASDICLFLLASWTYKCCEMLRQFGGRGGEGRWSEIEAVAAVATWRRWPATPASSLYHSQATECSERHPSWSLVWQCSFCTDHTNTALKLTRQLSIRGLPIVWPAVCASIKDKTRRNRMKLWHEKKICANHGEKLWCQANHEPASNCGMSFSFSLSSFNWTARRQDRLDHPLKACYHILLDQIFLQLYNIHNFAISCSLKTLLSSRGNRDHSSQVFTTASCNLFCMFKTYIL